MLYKIVGGGGGGGVAILSYLRSPGALLGSHPHCDNACLSRIVPYIDTLRWILVGSWQKLRKEKSKKKYDIIGPTLQANIKFKILGEGVEGKGVEWKRNSRVFTLPLSEVMS